MEVIVMKVKRKEGSEMVTGVIGAGIGPLAGDGLDEAFGLALGLRAVGTGEAMFDAELEAGLGEEFGAIGGAAVGQDALDLDAMSFVEVEGLLEGRQDAGSLFVWEERGAGDAGVIVDGDVQGLGAGAWVAVGADAGACEAAQLLDVEVEEIARRRAFVADDRRFWRIEGGEAVEAMAAQDAGEGSLGDGQGHADLGVGTAFAAQGEDLGFELGRSFAGLAERDRGTILEALGEPPPAGRVRASAARSFRRRQKSWP